MKKTKINFIIMFAIVLASVLTNNAFAQKSHCEKGGMHDRCKEGKAMGFLTDLTADQQKQIDALKLNLIKETINLKNQIEEKKAHITTISNGDNVDLAAVNKTFDELFALKAEIAKKHLAFQQEVRKLLTPEQKIKFDIHISKAVGHGKGSGDGDEKKCHKSGNGSKKGCQGQGQMDGTGKNCPKK